jgi:hypothetical protein
MFNVYGSTTNWEGNLWYGHHIYTPIDMPHRIVQFGHSCVMVDRDWYVRSGGYTTLQQGWGGEEPFLCLKAWMLGRECWMIPAIWHAHYLTPNAHGGAMVSENFARNFEMVKYVMNGDQGHLRLSSELIAERKKICAGPFHGNLSELKEHFKREGIVI